MLLNKIPHSLVKVDIAKGETRSEEIKKINRRGKVNALRAQSRFISPPASHPPFPLPVHLSSI
jgi:glutathione S-transferase